MWRCPLPFWPSRSLSAQVSSGRSPWPQEWEICGLHLLSGQGLASFLTPHLGVSLHWEQTPASQPGAHLFPASVPVVTCSSFRLKLNFRGIKSFVQVCLKSDRIWSKIRLHNHFFPTTCNRFINYKTVSLVLYNRIPQFSFATYPYRNKNNSSSSLVT